MRLTCNSNCHGLIVLRVTVRQRRRWSSFEEMLAQNQLFFSAGNMNDGIYEVSSPAVNEHVDEVRCTVVGSRSWWLWVV